MLTPKKMKIIIASVSTVGLGAGTAGLVYGLTKQPQKIVTTGHTLHVKYLNSPSAKDDIATYEHMLTIPESTVKTIASLPFDDPKDQDHHTKALDKIYSDLDKQHVVYDGKTYHKVTLTEDATWYVDLKPSHYHIYLHYWNDETGETVYNPSDWYPTKAYDDTTLGFTQRGAPTEVKNYEFLGWQLSLNNKPTATTKEECLYSVGESPRPDNYGNEWPVIPDMMKDSSGNVEPHTWHLHPIYKLTTATFSFYNEQGETISDSVDRPAAIQSGTREKFAEPVVDHYRFDHWSFKEDTKLKIDGTETPIAKGTPFKDEYLASNVEYLTPNISLVATLNQYQHCATFVMGESEDSPKATVWVDFDESDPSKRAQITERNLPKDPELSGSNKKFKYWTKDNVQVDWTKEFLTDDSTIYKPYFEETTATLSVDFPDNTYWTNGIQSEAATDITEIKLFDGDDGYRYTIEEITNEVKKAANKEGWELKGPEGTPDFYGWLINNKLQDSYALNKGANTAVANFNDAKKAKVTFNTDAGSFVCTNLSTSEEIKANSITYTLDITQNTSIEQAYKNACAATQARSEIKFVYDGYELSNQQEGEYYSCWEFEGSNLPKDYIVTKSMAVFAIYNEKQASNWWDDDWHTIASVANKGDDEMQKVYKDVYDGTKADKEGKVTKAANSWVGLEKEVTVSGYSTESFTTRVIGVNQDKISNTTNKALLTFDFVDCPFTGQYGDTNDYLGQGFENSTLKSIFKAALPDGIKNNMLKVDKYVVYSKSDSGEVSTRIEAQPFSTDLFLLSATEVASCSNYDSEKQTFSTNESAAEIEASCTGAVFFTYRYYEACRSNDNVEENVKRQKTYNNNTVSWWLRTPANAAYYLPNGAEGSGYGVNAFYVTAKEADGKPKFGGIYDYVTIGARGISPVFCLGGPIN